jgi:hypothetical protein
MTGTGQNGPGRDGDAVGGQAAGAPELVPAGFGTLRQDDISVTLRAGAVQVRVTPLAEWVIRLTAPDTYQRLSATAARLEAEARTRGETGLPVLASFFTDAAGGAAWEPTDLTLINRGRRMRAATLIGLTDGWGQGRLVQGVPAQGLYLFAGDVDLEAELVVEFGTGRSEAWTRILPRLETERARVRARAGGASDRDSRARNFRDMARGHGEGL